VAVAAVLAGAVHQPLDLALGQIAAFANCQLLQWLGGAASGTGFIGGSPVLTGLTMHRIALLCTVVNAFRHATSGASPSIGW
jgi:hypothetical protein